MGAMEMAQITQKDFDRLYGAACVNGPQKPGGDLWRKPWVRAVLLGAGIVILTAVLLLVMGMVGPRAGADFVVRAPGFEGPGSESGDSADVEPPMPVISELPRDESICEAPVGIWVHVDGAVVAPGVYGLPEGARVYEALDMAGGVVPGANMAPINLAAPVSDGSKVRVPFEGEETAILVNSAPGAPPALDSGLVNINTASAAELERLPGIGPALAAAIVEERQRGGPYATPEDLLRVSGIGDKKLAKLIGLVAA